MYNVFDHMIARVRWDATFDSSKNAFLLQNRLSSWTNMRMPAILNVVFDQVCTPESIVSLPRLEIDLGMITYEQLEDELDILLIKHLREYFLNLIAEADRPSAAAKWESGMLTRHGNIMEMLGHFFTTGFMPWNHTEEMGTLADMVDNALINDPASFLTMLHSTLNTNAGARKRLILQLPDSAITHIIQKEEPTGAKDIFSFKKHIEEIQKSERIVNVPEADLKKDLWLWIITYLFSEHGSVFNRRSFMRSMIRQMAAQHNIAYTNLLLLLNSSINKMSKSGKLRSDFLLMLNAIEEQDAPLYSKPSKTQIGANEISVKERDSPINTQDGASRSFWQQLHEQTKLVHDDQSRSNLEPDTYLDKNSLISSLASFIKNLLPTERSEFRTTFERSFKYINDTVSFFAKMSDRVFEDLSTALANTEPQLSVGEIRHLEAILRDAGLNMPAGILRKTCVDHYLAIDGGTKDITSLIGQILSVIALHNKLSVADVAEVLIRAERHSLRSGNFGNVSAAIHHVYQIKVCEEDVPATRSRIRILIRQYKHGRDDDPGHFDSMLQYVLSAVAHTKPANFWTAIATLRSEDLAVIGHIAGQEVKELLLKGYSEETCQLVSDIDKAAPVTSVHDEDSSMLVDARDILLDVVFNATFKGNANIQDVILPVIGRIYSKLGPDAQSQFARSTKKWGVRLSELTADNFTQIDARILHRLTAAWTKEIAALTGIAANTVKARLEKLTALYADNAIAVNYDPPIVAADMATMVLLDFDLRGPVAQQFIEFTSAKYYGKRKYSVGKEKLTRRQIAASVKECMQNTIVHPDKVTVPEQTVAMIRRAAEICPGKVADILSSALNPAPIIGAVSNVISFTAFCEAIAPGDVQAMRIKQLAQTYCFFETLWGRSAKKLKEEYWLTLYKILNNDTPSLACIRQIAEASLRQLCQYRKADLRQINSEITQGFDHLHPCLKEVLPAGLTIADDIYEVSARVFKKNEELLHIDGNVATNLIRCIIKNKHFPQPYIKSNVQEGIAFLVTDHPFSFFSVLKYGSLTETDMEWLYRNVPIDTVFLAIGSINTGVKQQLQLLKRLHHVFANAAIAGISAKQLQYLLFKAILNAWITGNWSYVAADRIWQTLARNTGFKRNVAGPTFFEGTNKIRNALPVVYKYAFDKFFKTAAASSEQLEMEKRRKQSEEAAKQGLHIQNAGLVLAYGYISTLFERLGITSEKRFRSTEMQEFGVHCLQFMATGQCETEEHHLVLNKLLCGLKLADPVSRKATLDDNSKNMMEGLISAMMTHWPKSGCDTIDGFRGTWFLRHGVLIKHEKKWELTIEKKPYDTLLSRSPFSFSIINYPWMEQPVYVNWEY